MAVVKDCGVRILCGHTSDASQVVPRHLQTLSQEEADGEVMGKPENELAHAALEYLKLRTDIVAEAWINPKGAVQRSYKGKRRFSRYGGPDGVGDILGWLVGGRFLSIETKIKPRKPTQDQLAFMERLNIAGGLGFVAYSLDDVIAAVDTIHE